MALRRTADGKTKPRGFYLPELPRPEYFTVQAFQRVLEASNWEVVNTLIRLGAEACQTQDGKRKMGELLVTFRTQAPCQANLPAILPQPA
jgi:hypothetical protein